MDLSNATSSERTPCNPNFLKIRDKMDNSCFYKRLTGGYAGICFAQTVIEGKLRK